MEEEDKSIYEDEVRQELEESDEISPEEEGFMLGYSKKKDDKEDEDEEDEDKKKDDKNNDENKEDENKEDDEDYDDF